MAALNSQAEDLNQILRTHSTAAYELLSKKGRNNGKVAEALEKPEEVVLSGENVIPATVEMVSAYTTIGETTAIWVVNCTGSRLIQRESGRGKCYE